MTPPRLTLQPHPDSATSPARTVWAEASRDAGVLALRFVLEGRLDDLLIPPQTAPTRTDNLWKHTCFEAFIRAPGETAYREFNLSPSTAWAAYDFSAFRERAPDPETAVPPIEVVTTPRLELATRLDLSVLKGPWQVALTAVVESRAGALSYWSLSHPPGRPEFHHAAGFVLDLPPS